MSLLHVFVCLCEWLKIENICFVFEPIFYIILAYVWLFTWIHFKIWKHSMIPFHSDSNINVFSATATVWYFLFHFLTPSDKELYVKEWKTNINFFLRDMRVKFFYYLSYWGCAFITCNICVYLHKWRFLVYVWSSHWMINILSAQTLTLFSCF